jgi:predicted ATPase
VEGKRFIRSLRLQNFLSYGNEEEKIELQPLNVLIGPNASGKSNLIEAIGILKALPTDLVAPIRQGGGISDFLWKGESGIPTAKIEAILDYPEGLMPLRYQINFTINGQRLEVVDEALEDISPRFSSEDKPFFYYHYNDRNKLVSRFMVALSKYLSVKPD